MYFSFAAFGELMEVLTLLCGHLNLPPVYVVMQKYFTISFVSENIYLKLK